MLCENSVKRWKCPKAGCKSYVKTNIQNDLVIIESHLTHNHPCKSSDLLRRQKLCNTLRRKAMEAPCESPMKLLEKTVAPEIFVTLTKKDIYYAKKNIYRLRTLKRKKAKQMSLNAAEHHQEFIPVIEGGYDDEIEKEKLTQNENEDATENNNVDFLNDKNQLAIVKQENDGETLMENRELSAIKYEVLEENNQENNGFSCENQDYIVIENSAGKNLGTDIFYLYPDGKEYENVNFIIGKDGIIVRVGIIYVVWRI